MSVLKGGNELLSFSVKEELVTKAQFLAHMQRV